ncbi:MAG: hypothetical protein FWC77_05115 [Defluviitaleaceae bacterium]|nr:hypothetical protein [Defluviitaleaceae bacterium]
MVVKNVTEELIREAMEFLSPDQQATANDLHELAKSIGLKIEMRRNLQKAGRGYYLEYSTKKPKRKLFYVHTHEQYKTDKITLRIKANLFSIDEYRESAERSPLAIKKSIKDTGNCIKCRATCFAANLKYTLDGVNYDPCYGQGHYFESLSPSEWRVLKELIVNEHNVITAVK